MIELLPNILIITTWLKSSPKEIQDLRLVHKAQFNLKQGFREIRNKRIDRNEIVPIKGLYSCLRKSSDPEQLK